MITLRRPDGLELPAEYTEGETMTALAEIKVTGDTIELMTLEGSEVSEVVSEEETLNEDTTEEEPLEDEMGPGGIPAGISNFVQGQLAQRSPGPGGLV